MKHKGFTLVEVLVVFMVLGIIAVLTLPAIMSNIQKHQVGPALTKAIATLDTANALMANEREIYDFSESCNNYLRDCFVPYIAKEIGAVRINERIEYGWLGSEDTQEYTNGYLTKGGFIYYVGEGSFSLTPPATIPIMVDINGIKKPNVIGKDLFYLTLVADDETGKVYADRSDALVAITGTGSWRRVCDKDVVLDGRVCAGSVIDNGGKVIYPWE